MGGREGRGGGREREGGGWVRGGREGGNGGKGGKGPGLTGSRVGTCQPRVADDVAPFRYLVLLPHARARARSGDPPRLPVRTAGPRARMRAPQHPNIHAQEQVHTRTHARARARTLTRTRTRARGADLIIARVGERVLVPFHGPPEQLLAHVGAAGAPRVAFGIRGGHDGLSKVVGRISRGDLRELYVDAAHVEARAVGREALYRQRICKGGMASATPCCNHA